MVQRIALQFNLLGTYVDIMALQSADRDRRDYELAANATAIRLWDAF